MAKKRKQKTKPKTTKEQKKVAKLTTPKPKEKGRRKKQRDRVYLAALVADLDKVDEQLLRLRLADRDITLEELATVVGVHRSAVHARMQKPAFVEVYNRAVAPLIEQLEINELEAAKEGRRLMLHAKDERVRAEMARFFLMNRVKQTVDLTVRNVAYKVSVSQDGRITREVAELQMAEDESGVIDAEILEEPKGEEQNGDDKPGERGSV